MTFRSHPRRITPTWRYLAACGARNLKAGSTGVGREVQRYDDLGRTAVHCHVLLNNSLRLNDNVDLENDCY